MSEAQQKGEQLSDEADEPTYMDLFTDALKEILGHPLDKALKIEAAHSAAGYDVWVGNQRARVGYETIARGEKAGKREIRALAMRTLLNLEHHGVPRTQALGATYRVLRAAVGTLPTEGKIEPWQEDFQAKSLDALGLSFPEINVRTGGAWVLEAEHLEYLIGYYERKIRTMLGDSHKGIVARVLGR